MILDPAEGPARLLIILDLVPVWLRSRASNRSPEGIHRGVNALVDVVFFETHLTKAATIKNGQYERQKFSCLGSRITTATQSIEVKEA